MPMVRYWKFKNSVEAKVTTNEDGAYVMEMEGEDQPFPGFPRGYLLFGKLSKLKHEIKNQIFNETWRKLDEKVPYEIIFKELNPIFDRIIELAEVTKYDQVPPTKMFKPVREVHRAWTKIAPGERSLKMRDILTFILQEDDGYRFRVQWMAEHFNPNNWYMRLCGKDVTKQLETALVWVERAEIIGDMKDKIKLLRRVLLIITKDKRLRELFLAFCKEVDWKKLYLSEADKYHFRGKYFRVDLDLFEY